MRKMKASRLILTLMICVLLLGCGKNLGIPKDWVYMSYEEAIELYELDRDDYSLALVKKLRSLGLVE